MIGNMSELVKRRTVQQARAREKRILEGITEIGPFIQDRDWEILGFSLLEDWVREKLTPVLKELDASLGAEIRNPIILQIDADQKDKPPAQRLRQREIGELTGVDHKTVSNVLRSSSGETPPNDDLDIISDQEKETVIDEELDLSQIIKEQFPPREPLQSTSEDASKWIPEHFRVINQEIDHVRDWIELTTDDLKTDIKEEITILREKLDRIEEMI